MKHTRIHFMWLFVLFFLILAFFAACSESDTEKASDSMKNGNEASDDNFSDPTSYDGDTSVSSHDRDTSDSSSHSKSGADSESPMPPSESGFSEDSANENQQSLAGTLTAGKWDDNKEFSEYLDYLSQNKDLIDDGSVLPVDVKNRRIITVVDKNNNRVRNAQVSISYDGKVLESGKTVSDGRFLFYPTDAQLKNPDLFEISVEKDSLSQTIQTSSTATITLSSLNYQAPIQLDLAFVIDTTGSMGDEIEYLKVEMEDIVKRVEQTIKDQDQGQNAFELRFGLVAYKDREDQYVTQNTAFTNDLQNFLDALDVLHASGGGDYPESLNEALHKGLDLGFSTDDSVKLMFVLTDAPPHLDYEQDITYVESMKRAKKLGIKLLPIAASGVDRSAEYILRQLAQYTLGEYIFLTDDSGVGNEHKDPEVGTFEVMPLNDLLVKIIKRELGF